MPYCAVFGCLNSSHKLKQDKPVKFYSFNKNEQFKTIWLNAYKRKDNINLKNAKICSEHFSVGCFF